MLGRAMEAAAVAAGLALASRGALADGERLFFEVSNALSPGQPTATVTLWTSFDPRDYCFGATLTEAQASEGVWSDPVLDPGMLWPGTTPGTVSADGRRVEGIVSGQFHLPDHVYGDPTNPIALWSARITVTDFTARDLELSTITSRYEVYLYRDSRTGRSALPTLTEASATIALVPAPGTLGVVAMGVLASRRRRARGGAGAGAGRS